MLRNLSLTPELQLHNLQAYSMNNLSSPVQVESSVRHLEDKWTKQTEIV